MEQLMTLIAMASQSVPRSATSAPPTFTPAASAVDPSTLSTAPVKSPLTRDQLPVWLLKVSCGFVVPRAVEFGFGRRCRRRSRGSSGGTTLAP